jgi:hypothetical protein
MAAATNALPDPPQSPKSPLPPDTLCSVAAFARFEFEPGRGNEGTKVLMVEWQDEDKNREPSGSWHVSWSGKTTALPADERASDDTRRVYFLLPPGTPIPPHIALLYQSQAKPKTSQPQSTQRLTVYPLPAIFTPELGATAKTSGKKGVLHTIWAKKRLQALDKEIRREQEFNLEGIALEMALAEKDWIENNFGLYQQKPPSLDLAGIPKSHGGPLSPSLQSPRTPGGRRLSDKLKGLSIATNEREWAAKINTPIRESHPLSPEGSDVAYSSFSAFRNGPGSPRASGLRKITGHDPPEEIKTRQNQSLNTFGYTNPGGGEIDDDLFAKALSPRSPDLPKSPFSFSTAEVAPFAKLKGER